MINAREFERSVLRSSTIASGAFSEHNWSIKGTTRAMATVMNKRLTAVRKAHDDMSESALSLYLLKFKRVTKGKESVRKFRCAGYSIMRKLPFPIGPKGRHPSLWRHPGPLVSLR